jgi:exodeoxyribonuclease-1
LQDNQAEITQAVQKIYQTTLEIAPVQDADQGLYDGFIDAADRRLCDEVQRLDALALAKFHPRFKDKKLTQLLLHFKARNYPESLNEDETENWFEIVQGRIQSGENGYLAIEEYFAQIQTLRAECPEQAQLWQQLESYGESLS